MSNYKKTNAEINENVNKLENMAKYFGLIFQLADDFEDYRQDKIKHKIGKNVVNYVLAKGHEKSFKDFKRLVDKFMIKSKENDMVTPEINQIIDFIVAKVKIIIGL